MMNIKRSGALCVLLLFSTGSSSFGFLRGFLRNFSMTSTLGKIHPKLGRLPRRIAVIGFVPAFFGTAKAIAGEELRPTKLALRHFKNKVTQKFGEKTNDIVSDAKAKVEGIFEEFDKAKVDEDVEVPTLHEKSKSWKFWKKEQYNKTSFSKQAIKKSKDYRDEILHNAARKTLIKVVQEYLDKLKTEDKKTQSSFIQSPVENSVATIMKRELDKIMANNPRGIFEPDVEPTPASQAFKEALISMMGEYSKTKRQQKIKITKPTPTWFYSTEMLDFRDHTCFEELCPPL